MAGVLDSIFEDFSPTLWYCTEKLLLRRGHPSFYAIRVILCHHLVTVHNVSTHVVIIESIFVISVNSALG